MFSTSLFQSNVSLKAFTTFGVNAHARYYLRLTETNQLHPISHLLTTTEERLPILALGGGSNVVLTRDFPGVVIHMALRGCERLSEDDQFIYVRAAAGEAWHDFVQWTIAQGWGGLENLSLIPGSVGAAPIQNIGAYGVELKDSFHSLSWYELATGKIKTLTKQDCQFAYRDSVFKQALRDKGLILDVTFALPKQWQPVLSYGDIVQVLQYNASPTPQEISSAICIIRQKKLPDPKLIGNAGSFFKNPVVSAETHAELKLHYPQLISYAQTDGHFKLAAGWLIEQTGWKGKSLGTVGVYKNQALVLVNLGGASGAEVVALATAIQFDVEQRFGVALEIEPLII